MRFSCGKSIDEAESRLKLGQFVLHFFMGAFLCVISFFACNFEGFGVATEGSILKVVNSLALFFVFETPDFFIILAKLTYSCILLLILSAKENQNCRYLFTNNEPLLEFETIIPKILYLLCCNPQNEVQICNLDWVKICEPQICYCK